MPSALLGGSPGTGGHLLSHPARPRGPTSPQAQAHSPSAPRFPAVRPRHLRQPHAPGDPCSHPLRPYRSAPRPRQRGPDTGRWTSRRKVSSEERGGTGRGGAGRGRRGGKGPAEEGERGGERPAGRLLPRRKRLGRPVPGTAPRLLITTINNEEDGVLPRCQAIG